MCVCICNKYVCVTIVMEGGIWGYRCERHHILGELFYDQLTIIVRPIKTPQATLSSPYAYLRFTLCFEEIIKNTRGRHLSVYIHSQGCILCLQAAYRYILYLFACSKIL